LNDEEVQQGGRMNPRKRTFHTAAAVLLFSCGVGSPVQGWLLEIRGQGDDDGKARSVAFDSAGNIVAGGMIPGSIGAVKVSRSGSLLWKTNALPGWGGVSAVAPNDDVAVVGAADNSSSASDVGVAMLSGGSGEVLFESSPYVIGNHWAQSVAFDALGNVLVGSCGGPSSGNANGLFTVDKFGSWTRSISTSTMAGFPGTGVAMQLAVDAAGSIIAVGRTDGVELNQFGQPVSTPQHLIVVKLSEGDGSVQWQSVLEESSLGIAVAVDGNGDVVVSGQIHLDESRNGDFLVLKLDGSDGSEIWRTVIDGGGFKDSSDVVKIDADGDVIAGGIVDLGPSDPLFGGLFGGVGVFTVVKLAGTDGSEIWQTRVPNDIANAEEILLFPPGVRGQAQDLAFDPMGNVVAVGAMNATWLSAGSAQARELVIVKLNANDGSVDWLQNVGNGEAFAVDVDGEGMIAVAGWTMHDTLDGSTNHFAVLGLSDCIAGRSLQLSDGFNPADRSLKLKTLDRLAHASARGTTGDPTLHGARLVLTDAGSMEVVEIDLPAGNWTARHGKFIYRDPEQNDGPCSSVKISNGKIIAKCRGAELDLISANAPMEALALRMELGSGAAPFCMEFGGDLRRNSSSSFQARNAPAPSRCLGR
jgi:hypothetical protein